MRSFVVRVRAFRRQTHSNTGNKWTARSAEAFGIAPDTSTNAESHMARRQRKLTHMSQLVLPMLAITQFIRQVPVAGPAFTWVCTLTERTNVTRASSLVNILMELSCLLSVPWLAFNLYRRQSCVATGVTKNNLIQTG